MTVSDVPKIITVVLEWIPSAKKVAVIPLLILILAITVHAADLPVRSALERQGAGEKAVNILLAQANVESCYEDAIGLKSVKGVARHNGWNIWNMSAVKGNVVYEREGGRLIKKRWTCWDTPDEAAQHFIAYLNRKYPHVMKYAERGDTRGYVHELKKGGYFTCGETEYRRGLERRM